MERRWGDRVWWAILLANLAALGYFALRVPARDAAVVLVAIVLLDVAAFFWQIVEAAVSFGRGRRTRRPAGSAPGQAPEALETPGEEPVIEVRLER